jgi:hypothetical protein
MKSYTCSYSGPSKVATALVSQLAPDKSGHVLVESGFTQDNFSLFLSRLAIRAVALKYDEVKLSALFRQMAACNASQARQALADVVITVDGEKPQSLGKFWGETPKSAPADASLYAGL